MGFPDKECGLQFPVCPSGGQVRSYTHTTHVYERPGTLTAGSHMLCMQRLLQYSAVYRRSSITASLTLAGWQQKHSNEMCGQPKWYDCSLKIHLTTWTAAGFIHHTQIHHHLQPLNKAVCLAVHFSGAFLQSLTNTAIIDIISQFKTSITDFFLATWGSRFNVGKSSPLNLMW